MKTEFHSIHWIALLLVFSLSPIAASGGNRGGTFTVPEPIRRFVAGDISVNRLIWSSDDGVDSVGEIHLVSVNPEGKSSGRLSQFDWGSISCSTSVSANRVDYTVVVRNSSSKTLRGIGITLRTVEVPGHDLGPGEMTPGVDSPGVVLRDWDTGSLAICGEDVGRPLYLGWLPSTAQRRSVDIQLATYRDDRFPPGWLTTPRIARPIQPGGIDTFHLSVRLSPSRQTIGQIAADLLHRYSQAYPSRLKWTDRRPVGTLHLAAVEWRKPFNPRGWLTGDGSVDTTTPEGMSAFQRRLLEYADNSVRVLQGMDAQGVIAWDIEGDEFPHATTYIGDPRSLPPEVEPVIDAFFKRFTDAGLKVGICIRPSLPVRPVYGATAMQISVDDPVYLLDQKISFARKRWGCSLFYVDSNVVYDPRFKPDNGKGYELMQANVFQRVAADNPDVLLMPEQKSARYYAYTAPYTELRQDHARTPELVRGIYPGSFSTIYVPDGSIERHRAELEAAVRSGDILLFRAWFDDEVNARIRALYRSAHP